MGPAARSPVADAASGSGLFWSASTQVRPNKEHVEGGLVDVQSRHVVERIQSESFRLLCPELAKSAQRGEPAQVEGVGE